MSAVRPFALRGATDAVSTNRNEERLELRYDPKLQRNEVLIGDSWIDVTAADGPVSATTLLTMTGGATMTEVNPGSGAYKLDDDR